MNPILSIVIPTKDRELYLLDIVEYILSWGNNNFEVIVQDNSNNDKLFLMLQRLLTDSRLKYFKTREWLSVIENFEMAINNTSGQVVTMIGDDDGVLEESIAVAEWMLENGVEAVLPQCGEYTWPDLVSSYNSDYYNSKLRIKNKFTSNVESINSQEQLLKVLKQGASTLAMLPRLYYGLVTKDVLNKVKAQCGVFFPGPSPDMANAISVALVVDTFVKLDYPLFISGSCSASTSGMGVKRKHEGDIEKKSHLPKNCKQEWETTLPLFWSGSTVWAESAIKSIKKMDKSSILTQFNYSYFFARCLVFNSSRFEVIVNTINSNKMKHKFPIIVFYYLSIWGVRARTLFPKIIEKIIKNNSSKLLIIEEKTTISLALWDLKKYLKSEDINLNLKRSSN